MKKLFLLPAVIFLLIFLFSNLPAFAAAPVGNYLVLNGGYVKTTRSDSSIPSAFSFKASINPTSVSGKQIILSVGDKTNGKRYYEIGINGGALFVDYGYNGFNSLISSSGLTAGNWQDIDVEITSAQTKLLVNGSQIAGPFITNSLGPIGPSIVLGDSYKESFFESKPFKGLIDEVTIANGSNVLIWHLDEARGAGVSTDSSGNNLNGMLNGADNLIHFFGVLPTPTPFTFGLPPINWTRPVLPTLSLPFPNNPQPTSAVNPPDEGNPAPTSGIRDLPRRTGR